MKQRLLLDYLISSLVSDMAAAHLSIPRFDLENRPEEIWKQKVFCILSSQFNARRAAAISNQMMQRIPFFDNDLPIPKIEEACLAFLTSPEIGYRFPNVKSKQIADSWWSFAQVKDVYHDFIQSFDSERQARASLVETFPGIGLKQASMLLRNIGASKTLSVIDVHLLYYLEICRDWPSEQLTPKRYLQAEEIINNDAQEYGVDLNVFDVIVWSAAKAVKRASSHV